jgi:hypothetical protein
MGKSLVSWSVSTARKTYANPGSVTHFDFHQSYKSNVSFPVLSCLSSNDLMDPARAAGTS